MTTPTLRFVYFDGPTTTYVHDAEVRTASDRETHTWTECVCECDSPRILHGQVVVVTDPGVEGESVAHLTCLLLTASYGQGHLAVYTDEEVAALQEERAPRHAAA